MAQLTVREHETLQRREAHSRLKEEYADLEQENTDLRKALKWMLDEKMAIIQALEDDKQRLAAELEECRRELEDLKQSALFIGEQLEAMDH
jgi:hypothetical protein